MDKKQYIMDGQTNGQKTVYHGRTDKWTKGYSETVYHGWTEKWTKNSISWTEGQKGNLKQYIMDGHTNGQKQYIMDGQTNGQKGNRKQYIMDGQTNGQKKRDITNKQ
jgi:hypothetical protein